jgi:tRNA-splicing ligase RtcB
MFLQECAYIEQVSDVQYVVKPGFVPGMHVPGTFYVNAQLKDLLFEELQQSVQRGEVRPLTAGDNRHN